MMIILAFKKRELKEKTQYANFSLPIKNPNSLLKNGYRIRIRIQKLGGFRIRIRIANPNDMLNFRLKIRREEWVVCQREGVTSPLVKLADSTGIHFRDM